MKSVKGSFKKKNGAKKADKDEVNKTPPPTPTEEKGERITLPAGKIGMKFAGLPPVITGVSDDSPLKDKVKIGQILESIVIPGQNAQSKLDSVAASKLLKDSADVEGRVIVLGGMAKKMPNILGPTEEEPIAASASKEDPVMEDVAESKTEEERDDVPASESMKSAEDAVKAQSASKDEDEKEDVTQDAPTEDKDMEDVAAEKKEDDEDEEEEPKPAAEDTAMEDAKKDEPPTSDSAEDDKEKEQPEEKEEKKEEPKEAVEQSKSEEVKESKQRSAAVVEEEKDVPSAPALCGLFCT
mmetsp:Transcript_49389/g.148781  ORF Transcript_49389/g.148781 Transcript_49389/m.148781 type:complete len:297 (-) Transcript_49389:243-1133(-)